ncbi:hypothetical protein [Pseudonocardia sp. McavD-2-B]|uniref:hypothetical protein n=1 Tax=Pseudonocardia sp. McavD-2-B TaxID=2954499 RepID=UPI0020986359|nr:hypothetical protein [Pseudonocardia sp. McavD-2-B]MCO7191496.1 hypothetical protein [Pseudonocardia sp. McavD-2-B]
MSKVVDAATTVPRWAVKALRGLTGATDQRPDGVDGPGRWLVVTVYRKAEDVRTQVDDSGPLSRMRGEIELTVRPAPGDKGTELAARPTTSDDGQVDARRRLRAALRETKSILECGEVVEPSRPGSSHPGPAGHLLRAVTARAWGEGRL